MLKPGVTKNTQQLSGILLDLVSHYGVLALDVRTLSQEEAEFLYAEHRGKEYFERTVNYMTSDKSVLLVLTGGENIIAELRQLIGPTDPTRAADHTLRGKYFKGEYTCGNNLIHASSSEAAFQRETSYLLPEVWTRYLNEQLRRSCQVR